MICWISHSLSQLMSIMACKWENKDLIEKKWQHFWDRVEERCSLSEYHFLGSERDCADYLSALSIYLFISFVSSGGEFHFRRFSRNWKPSRNFAFSEIVSQGTVSKLTVLRQSFCNRESLKFTAVGRSKWFYWTQICEEKKTLTAQAMRS